MRTRAGLLIGREVELAAALTSVRDSARGSGGPACFCLGEPGAGKSRLLLEIAEQARADGLVVVRGRASAIGPVSPLRPFAEALAAIHRRGLLPDDHLGGYRPLLARVLPQLSDQPYTDPEEVPPIVTFGEAVLRVLTRVGSGSGCLLMLDDMQDADPESLAVLEYLLDNRAGAPVAVLGALRDEPCGAREMLAVAERRGVAQLVPVRRLDVRRTGMLIAACLDMRQPPAELVELIWRNSAGNPLVVEELLYDMIDNGQLSWGGDGELRLSVGPGLAPPPSMVQLIGARMNRMDRVSRRTLVTAAVYGEQFPLLTVEAAAGAGDPTFEEAIELGVAHQLIVAEAPGWYRFHHPLTHSAILELAGPAERRQRAARLAEAVLAEDPDQTVATCRLAARLLADAGSTAAAAELYARAGREALATSAVEWAVADLTEAIRLMPSQQRLPLDLIGDLVLALTQACRLDTACELIERLGPAVDGPSSRARAMMHLDVARSCHNAGRIAQARVQLAYARALAAGEADELLRIHCDAVATRLAFDPAGEADPVSEQVARSAAESAERLIDIADDGATARVAADAACRAWSALILHLRGQDRYQEVCTYRQRIGALVDRYQLHDWVLWVRSGVVIDQLMADGEELPIQLLRDDAQRLGAMEFAVYLDTRLLQHKVMAAEGSLTTIKTALAQHVEQGQRLGDITVRDSALGALLLAAGLRADRSELNDLLGRCQPSVSGAPTWLEGEMEAAQAMCLAMEGCDDEALAKLTGLARRGGVGPYFGFFPHGPMILLATMAEAASAHEVAEALRTSSRLRWTRQFLHWAAAVHAGRRGEPDMAARHAEQATQAGAIYPATRHLAARLTAPAAAADGWGNPIEDLRAAEEWFHEQDAPAAARNCRDVLRALGAPVHQRRFGTDTVPIPLRAVGVTAREYEIGLLLREHLGNRAIGERLHISPRTVEKHMAALRTKLTAPDRRTLIDRIADAH